MRYALYFTPAEEDPLARAAVDWLGRDAATGETTSPPAVPGLRSDELAAITAEPRRYGFHATLKAPFRLRDGEAEASLIAAMRAFCAGEQPFAIPRLTLSRIGPFFALVPAEPDVRLDAFAAAVVEAFEPFRAPLSEAEIARRRPDRLSEAQRDNLHRWGYPYVLEDFRFHMTLTGPVDEARAPTVERALADWFAPVLDRPVAVSDLTLFVEPAQGEPFDLYARIPLGDAR